MYWYYKYPLLAVLCAVLFGICYLIWTKLPDDVRGGGSDERGPDAAEEASGTPVMPPDFDPLTGRQDEVTPGGTLSPALPAPSPGYASEDVEKWLKGASQQLAQDQLLAARTLARKVLKAPGIVPFDRYWLQAADVISQVNTILMNGDAPCPEKTAYIIQPGDTLVGIAKRFGSTVASIQRVNNLDPVNPVIHAGRVMHVLSCEWSIQVYRDRYSLLLMDGDELFKLYPIAVGKQGRTPTGVFRVENKLREPAWRSIPYGDPENVLGTRWLGLEPIEDTPATLVGYGIHGTWEPDSIGAEASQGCLRLRNDMVEELFDLIPIGVRVTIRDGV
jgi:hypothetical protein